MIEIVAIIGLICTIGILLAERYVVNKTMREERKEWTKGMLAKNLRELTDNEALEKLPEQEEQKPPDFIPAEDMDDELFDRHMEAIKAKAKDDITKELGV